MRSFEDASQCWRRFNAHASIGVLQSYAGRPRDDEDDPADHLRSVFWKIFLLFETSDTTRWRSVLQSTRCTYSTQRAKCLRALRSADEVESLVDPLSNDADSPWVAIRNDETLRNEILQDVERCMPDNLYFRQPKTQTRLWDVLFTWAKLHPDIGYRQGMHELAAPILWAVERDAIDSATRAQRDTQIREQDDLLQTLLDQRYIEHDTFTLFELVMRDTKSSYEHRSEGAQTTSRAPPMVERCQQIVDVYLRATDPDLATHLDNISVIPQVFLLRWIRLLFGREFSFDNTLRLWDRMFAVDHSTTCVDLICVAMILHIRWQLLEADYNTALTLLLHYPEPSSANDIVSFVDDALYLRDHMTPDGGIQIILRRTGRRPIQTSKAEAPRTPNLSLASLPSRLASPTRQLSKLTQHPAGLEGLLEDAARGIYLRGERLGLNQAVRGVVTEVRKNVQNMQTKAQSRMQSTNILSGFQASDLSRSALMERIDELEARDRALGHMLDDAVGALWTENQKMLTDRPTKEGETDSMTTAIAKVQFVQVYLMDSALSLPFERVDGDEPPVSEVEPEIKQPSASETIFDATSVVTDARGEGIVAGDSHNEVPTATSSSTMISVGPASPEATKTAGEDQIKRPPKQSSNERKRYSRPSLEQSSFSWMLGQEDKSTAARSAFMSASRFKEGSTRGKSSAHGSAAFLFGEEEEDFFSGPKGKEREKKNSTDMTNSLFKLGEIRGKDGSSTK